MYFLSTSKAPSESLFQIRSTWELVICNTYRQFLFFLPTLESLQKRKCVFSLWLFLAIAEPSPLENPQFLTHYFSAWMTGNAAQRWAHAKLPTWKGPKKVTFLTNTGDKFCSFARKTHSSHGWQLNAHQRKCSLIRISPGVTSFPPCAWIFSSTYFTNWIYFWELLKNLFLLNLTDARFS